MGLFRRRRRDADDVRDWYADGTAPPDLPPLPEARFEGTPVAHDPLAAAPPPVTDPAEQDRRLADLRDRGLLSDAEYAEQRLRVLGE